MRRQERRLGLHELVELDSGYGVIASDVIENGFAIVHRESRPDEFHRARLRVLFLVATLPAASLRFRAKCRSTAALGTGARGSSNAS